MGTKHRIPANKGVIEPDPRARQAITFEDYSGPDRRNPSYAYGQGLKIICIPLDSQPPTGWGLYSFQNNIGLFYKLDNKKTAVKMFDCTKAFREKCPFISGDILILQEEFREEVHEPTGMVEQWVKSELADSSLFTDWQSSETMPDHLGQQFIVDQCLGIKKKQTMEEVPTLTNPIMMKPIFREIWYWKILEKEKLGESME